MASHAADFKVHEYGDDQSHNKGGTKDIQAELVAVGLFIDVCGDHSAYDARQ